MVEGQSCRNGSSQKLSQAQLLRQPSCDACDKRPIFMTPSFVSLGTGGNFAQESGEGS